MKLSVLTISFLIGTLSLSGQNIQDTVVPIKYIDSLKIELANLKDRNNFLFWNYQEKVNVSKIDTVFIRADSSIITFSLKDGKILKRQFNLLGKDNNVILYSNYYYNNLQQVKYIQNWATMTDEFFTSRLLSAERLEYDSLGRQVLSITYLQSVHRTIRRNFWYDQNGTKQSKVEIIKSYALWNE